MILSFQPFVHSFVSFEILPLVEFQLEEGISDKEALLLIESSPKSYAKEQGGKQAKSKSGIDVLTLGGDDYDADPFSSKWVQSVRIF